MSNEKVKQAHKYVIGTKQTVKALKKNTVKEVFIANDADPRVINVIIELTSVKDIPVNYENTVDELGKIYGVKVGAAAVAIIS